MRRISKGRITAAALSLAVMTTLTGATVAGAAGNRAGTRSVFVPSSPVRVLDTRDGRGVVGGTVGKVAADGEIVVDFAAALGDLPADTTALTFNLTYVDGEGVGFATVWPDGESMPNVSNLNKVGAGPVANLATVKVGPAGRVRLHNTGGRSHYIMDFSGYYETISTTSAVIGQKGDTGPAGPTGPAGAKGDTGAMGAAGLNGATGATGASGPNGVAGAPGPAGAKGDAGVAGPTGATGASGPAGVAGAAGPTGPQGSAGVAGPMGLTGRQGADGASGSDGATGAAGARGADGAPGAPGARGADGAPGAKGADGAAGATGAKGTDGAAGARGADGAAGATGAAGADGAVGATGPTGPRGPSGTGGRHTLTPSQAAASAWDKDAYRSFTHVVAGHRFTALAFDGTNMWALDQDNAQAVVLDGISGEVVDTITLPSTPLAVVSDGISVWISLKDPALVQFAATTRAVQGIYPMDIRGDVLAVTPMADSARLWAADRNSSKVQAYDNAGALSYTVEIIGAAQGLAVGSNGLIWAAGKDFLQAIDINSGNPDRTTDPVGWEIGAVAYDGEYLYVTEFSGSRVAQIEESSGKVGWTKSWCSGSGSVPIVFDGRYLYEFCTSDTLLIRIDTTLDVFADVKIPVSLRPQAAAFDGHNIWIAMPDDQVVKRMRPSFN
jgi:Collagen triple helix repeat (20 copies)